MLNLSESCARAFKTAWFAKAAKKALITDVELCDAMRQVMQGQTDDLGGGVYKKRLNSNRHRSIILAKAGRYWVYEYLFAKKDRDNIEDDELASFRVLAKAYAGMTNSQLTQLLQDQDLMEICHEQT
ncbi:type II toxin-antitoxin system RelE/ParE family toxin [Iodobacter arcticus]|uniref:Type II toxin-antitoxin system RelE/ParE family toxin n=1 Tax=Iodobacter arcticus TaxID=590593 RepID=A0ABW2QW36_9NEIS